MYTVAAEMKKVAPCGQDTCIPLHQALAAQMPVAGCDIREHRKQKPGQKTRQEVGIKGQDTTKSPR